MITHMCIIIYTCTGAKTRGFTITQTEVMCSYNMAQFGGSTQATEAGGEGEGLRSACCSRYPFCDEVIHVTVYIID